jgi:GT2 family glycosyltransferase
VDNSSAIAVLMTVHNRCEATLKCLDSLYAQQSSAVPFVVYLVNDGSTDNTAEAVRSEFPDVKILTGNGQLFWSGGMRMAFAEAAKSGYGYYLWLNDDVVLFPGAINTLLETYKEVRDASGHAIIVGSTLDPVIGERSYGGGTVRGRMGSGVAQAVIPQAAPQKCDIFTGNIVLIPRCVFDVLGNISSQYTHSIGDTDYALRAGESGIQSWVAPGYLGTCPQNTENTKCFDSNVPIVERYRYLCSPKGLPPGEYLHFLKRHYGLLGYYYLAKLFLRVLAPDLFLRVKRIVNKADAA